MERQRPSGEKRPGIIKRTVDLLKASTRPPRTLDESPRWGWVVPSGTNWAVRGDDLHLSSEEIAGVLNKITPEVHANAMKDLAATPVSSSDKPPRPIYVSSDDLIRLRAKYESKPPRTLGES